MTDIVTRLRTTIMNPLGVSAEQQEPMLYPNCAEAAIEIERMRSAIEWACGEIADPEGKWFGECEPPPGKYPRPYWWRTHLRRLAGFPVYSYDKERRTVTDEQTQKP